MKERHILDDAWLDCLAGNSIASQEQLCAWRSSVFRAVVSIFTVRILKIATTCFVQLREKVYPIWAVPSRRCSNRRDLHAKGQGTWRVS